MQTALLQFVSAVPASVQYARKLVASNALRTKKSASPEAPDLLAVHRPAPQAQPRRQRAQPRRRLRRLCAYRMAAPAPPAALRAVAATAPTARVPVQLVGPCSPTAHARWFARVTQCALLAGPSNIVDKISLDRRSAQMILCSVRLAQRISAVLPGSIVIL